MKRSYEAGCDRIIFGPNEQRMHDFGEQFDNEGGIPRSGDCDERWGCAVPSVKLEDDGLEPKRGLVVVFGVGKWGGLKGQ
jgi:hypothetical protein